VAATLVGIAINFLGLNPIRALYWFAVITGVVAVPLMVMLKITSANKSILGKVSLTPYLRIVGWAATAVMLLASLALIVSSVRGLF
jgi:Mn2+/Fe2+ NRAMP family transporter